MPWNALPAEVSDFPFLDYLAELAKRATAARPGFPTRLIECGDLEVGDYDDSSVDESSL